MMLSDEAIDDALSRNCDRCGAGSGVECVTLRGVPLIDVDGIPVHLRRVEDQ
jgi:hypothetical protein